MRYTFKVGDCLVHKSAGVCKVVAIVKEDFGSGLTDFYVLEPYCVDKSVSSNSQTLVRVDNPVQIREFAKKDEVMKIYNQIENLPPLWINDSKHRKELFQKILLEGNLLQLCQLIRTVYLKKNEYIELKKNVPITDNTLCANAEKLVYEEFAISLKKTPNFSSSCASFTLKPYSAQSSFEKIKVSKSLSFCHSKYILLISKFRVLVFK